MLTEECCLFLTVWMHDNNVTVIDKQNATDMYVCYYFYKREVFPSSDFFLLLKQICRGNGFFRFSATYTIFFTELRHF